MSKLELLNKNCCEICILFIFILMTAVINGCGNCFARSHGDDNDGDDDNYIDVYYSLGIFRHSCGIGIAGTKIFSVNTIPPNIGKRLFMHVTI